MSNMFNEIIKNCPDFVPFNQNAGNVSETIVSPDSWRWNYIVQSFSPHGWRKIEGIMYFDVEIRKETTILYKNNYGSGMSVEKWKSEVYYISPGGMISHSFLKVMADSILLRGDQLSKDLKTAMESTEYMKLGQQLRLLTK